MLEVTVIFLTPSFVHSAYKNLLYCQYYVIVSGICQRIKLEANTTLHDITTTLDGLCDHVKLVITTQLPMITTVLGDAASTTSPLVTTVGQCHNYESQLEQLKVCSDDIMSRMETYKPKDWQDDDTVEALCRYGGVPGAS